MERISIFKFELKHIEDTLRLTSNAFNSQKKETCLDRMICKSLDYSRDRLKKSDAVVPAIKNKLSPFWNLVELLVIEDKDLPEDAAAYLLLIRNQAIKCQANREEILLLLNSLNS